MPYQGFTASSFEDIESNGESWYNALDVTLEKRISHGLQFLASYTYARALSTDQGSVNGANGGTIDGNQNSPSQTYGPDSFIRPQRFVFSAFYACRSSSTTSLSSGQPWADGGSLAFSPSSPGSGSLLTTKPPRMFSEITLDRVQIAAGCTYPQLETSGGTEARLTNYFNKSCITTAPVIGADGKGTTFGDAGIGIVHRTRPGEYRFLPDQTVPGSSLGTRETGASRRILQRLEPSAVL